MPKNVDTKHLQALEANMGEGQSTPGWGNGSCARLSPSSTWRARILPVWWGCVPGLLPPNQGGAEFTGSLHVLLHQSGVNLLDESIFAWGALERW